MEGIEAAKFLTVAWRAARAAGDLIRAQWRQPRTIDYKGAVDLVTSVDREAERRIVGILLDEFPGHSILAEEEARIAGWSTEYRWIIDPLDGTTNFAHGYPQVAVSIALEYQGETVLGLVYDPLRRECFRAVRNRGATLNRAPIHVSAVSSLERALLATGFPYDRRENAAFYLNFVDAFLKRCQGIRRAGAAALDLCYVAAGRIDGYWEMKLKPWDIAAGALIVAEAGGCVSGFSGDSFALTGDQTLASNGSIHEQMTRVLASVGAARID